MKPKTIVTAVLLSFVVLSVGWLIVRPGPDKTNEASNTSLADSATASAPGPGQTAEAPPAPKVLADRVIVYYFHTTSRCPTCHKIENYTKEAVEAGFAQAQSEGRLEFLALNVEEPANSHFIQDYELHTKSVVVVDMQDGKQAQWKNLAKVWELTGNKDGFIKYIQDEVNLYLQGK